MQLENFIKSQNQLASVAVVWAMLGRSKSVLVVVLLLLLVVVLVVHPSCLKHTT